MSRDYPKSITRKLRELIAQAHEREMARELAKLAEKFHEWQAGKLSVWELTDLIHAFHSGPARQLFSYYNGGDDDLLVAGALVKGILAEAEVPADVRQAIQGLIDFVKQTD
jgi:hypothetical protein